MGYLIIAIAMVTFTIMMSKIWTICLNVFWRPYSLTRHFRKQGVMGPRYSLLYGSLNDIKTMIIDARKSVMAKYSHNLTQRVLPHYHIWSSLYGEIFLFWYGTEPMICISDIEQVKEILSNKLGFYPQRNVRPSTVTLVGEGIALMEGVEWVRRRRILTPAFSMDKLKIMISRMAACTISMVDEWKRQAIETKEKSKTIEMTGEFKELTANIIAHTAFGTSYAQGREAFKAQTELQLLVVASSFDVFIPGTQYLPTKLNIEIWKLDRKMKKTLQWIIERRLNSQSDCSYGDDLLGILLDAKNDGANKLKMNEIMEECKTFFFAGHETISNWLVWTVFLLSLHKDWQEKLRQEIFEICGKEVPDADMLSKLKMVNIVLLEALRLYCPAIELERRTSKDVKLGNLMIPKATNIRIPITVIHRSTKYWGEDANEFNPMRFINGVTKAANHPNALLAFSVGPRNCIGQNFAMLEAKTVMTLILQRFSWSLSPEYQHAPVNNLTLEPQHGLPIIIKPLEL